MNLGVSVRAIFLLFGLSACGSVPVAELDGPGGDVWAFEKRVEGAAADCDEVWVESPRGRVRADFDGERFAAIVPLAEGENPVQAVCVRGRKESLSDPQPWRVQLDDRPTALARVGWGEEGLLLDGGGSAQSEVRTAAIASWTWTARAGNPAPIELVAGGALDEFSGPSLEIATPAVDGDYVVELTVTDTDGETDTAAAMFRVAFEEPLVLDVERDHPAWVDDAVVYGVAPYFFDGGGFAGVTDRLDELEALGVTVLWLSPVTASPEDDFGYAVTNHMALRDTFGPEADLRALIDDAHGRGMRVIMDFVPNHTSDRHPWYVGQADDPTSPYADYYERWEDGTVSYYFEWENLPNLDYDNPEVRRYMTEAFAYWVREYGVDGFRVDVAWGVRDRAPEYWLEWSRELHRIDPDLLLVAEASAREPYWFDNGFDAAYDWTWELGDWAWLGAWEDPTATTALLRKALTNEGEGFADDALIFRFLANNDTGERFVTRYGPERVPTAAALLLTLPGLPMLYTGDEVGAALEPYDEGPPIAWDDPHGLQPVYERLIRLRHELPALRSRDWALLDVQPAPSVLGYLRTGPRASVLVLLNFSDKPVVAEVPVGPLGDLLADGELRDRYAGQVLTAAPADGDPLEISLPAWGVRILTRP